MQSVGSGISDNAWTFFSLSFSYLAKRLWTGNYHLLADLLFYVKNHADGNQIFLPYDDVEIWRIFTEGKTSIYWYLPRPPIYVNINDMRMLLWFKLFIMNFLNPEIHLFLFLPFNTCPHSLTLCRQDFSSNIMQNPSWAIQNLIISFKGYFDRRLPASYMVIKN